MINLLPDFKKNELKHRYRLRLVVILLGLLFAVVVVANILLIPSLILSYTKLSMTQDQTKGIASGVDDARGEQYKKIAERTNKKITFLSESEGGGSEVSAGYITKKITQTLGTRVSLSGLMYQRGDKTTSVQITGLAKDRDGLIAFRDRLSQMGLFSNVVLPVSSLVSDTDISFTMQLEVNSDAKIDKET